MVAPEGAGLADLVGLLGASPWAWSIHTLRVPTEGPTARERIAAAIAAAAAHGDLVVITRGGGAAVGLPYDAEVVATAVCRCPVPILAALGHSDDRTVVDEMAWRSVPTPSAAAGLLCELPAGADSRLVRVGDDIAQLGRVHLERAERRLAGIEAALSQDLAVARARAERPSLAAIPAPPPLDVGRLRRVALVCAVVALMALVALAVVLGGDELRRGPRRPRRPAGATPRRVGGVGRRARGHRGPKPGDRRSRSGSSATSRHRIGAAEC